MSLLDEAIREHLELKRRRGADPAEVSQQEDEALGPVRREPEAAGAEPDAPAREGLEPESAAGGPEAREEPATALYDVQADVGDERGGAIASSAFRAEEEPAAAGEDEWGFDDDEEPEAAAEPEPDEDPLEETPDFLQETPEHDRLWFEQKPPRDFDFDN